MASVYQRESSLELKGDVISVKPLSRDQDDRKVFSVVIEDLAARERNLAQNQDVSRIHIHFPGDWADACSFISAGDTVQVRKFTVDTNPSPNSPFALTVNANSEVTVDRHRRVMINASNAKNFEYHEEISKQSQTYQTLLMRGANQFSRMGGYYDAVFGQRCELPRFDFLLSILEGYQVQTVLDCACGTGLFCFFLKENNVTATGLDCGEIMMEVFQQKNETEETPIQFHRADITDFQLLADTSHPGEAVSEVFDCALCLDALQLLPDIQHVRLAIRNFWYHIKPSGHMIIDLPNPYATPQGALQSIDRYELSRHNLCAIGNPCVLEDGHLDVVKRSYTEKGRRVHEWYGFAQQYSKQKKAKYFTNWTERFDELQYNPPELEALIEEEGFHIVALYGDQVGAEFDPKTSPRRFYVCARKFMGTNVVGDILE